MKKTLCLLACVLSMNVMAAPITDLVAFGDSLSDSGNLYAVTGMPSSPPYFEGRFSDGPTFVEYLNANLGFGPMLPSIMGGQNYAWGGARAGFDLPISGGAIPGVMSQTQAYLASNPTITPNTLFSIFIGNNDVSDAIEQDLTIAEAQGLFANAINQIVSSIQLLQAQGATQFITPLVPDWSLTPRYFGNNKAQALTEMFNTMAQQSLTSLSSIDLTLFDTVSFFADNSDEFLIKDSACLLQGCQNPDDYLFFDDIHPTAKAHQLFAQALQVAVPIPQTLWLFLFGLSLVLLKSKRSSMQSSKLVRPH